MKECHRVPLIVWIIAIVLMSAVVLWPIMRPGFFISDDGEWMIIRLSAFYQSLAEGQFPVRFLGRLNHSYGYPVSNFLYPGFLYIGSIIHRIGFSFVDSVKVILAGSVVGGAIILFLWLRRFYRPFASYMGTVGFVFGPYVLFDVYHRGSVGEILGIFAAILAWYSVSSGKTWIVPWSVALLLVSHNSLALLFIVLLVCYMLVERKFQNWKPMALGVAMTAFFWFPAIYERRYVLFDSLQIAKPSNYFVDAKVLYLLNIVPMIAAIVLLTSRQNHGIVRRLRFFLIAFMASTILATPVAAILWKQPLLIKLFQFPYRFLSVGVVVGPWLIAEVIHRANKRLRIGICMVFAATWLIPWWTTMQRVDPVVREVGFYTTNEGTTTVADEYMPRWVQVPPKQRAEKPIEFFSGKGTIQIVEPSTQKIDAIVDASERSVMRINTVYYPGWGVQVDGLPAAIDYQNARGIMLVAIPAGKHRVNAEFRETVPRFVADTLSVIAAIVALVYSFAQINKKKGITA